MSWPDDRVLVGVINRLRDLNAARDAGWYRVPLLHYPYYLDAAYIGLFLSRAFGDMNGAVHYFAAVRGVELCYRHWLLPDESDHPRADALYYRVALGPLIPKVPPIRNSSKRRLAFVHTTWDRFSQARHISELYARDQRFTPSRLDIATSRRLYALMDDLPERPHPLNPDDSLYTSTD